MVMVSIVIPIYNCAEYLKQCIESVLKQSLNEIEIICIDDGSTDYSAQIVKQFQKEHEKIILIQQINQGAGIARNLGLQKARGKYVAFLDADDFYMDRNALELMVDACEKRSMAICASIRMGMKKENESVKELFSKDMKDAIVQYRDYQGDYYYQTYLFQRELLVKNKIFFPIYRRYQDPPFFVKAAYKAKQFIVVDTCLYCYRIPDAGTRYNTEKVCDLLKGIIDNLLFAKQHRLDILFENTIRHLENDFTYTIYENIFPNDLRILKLLMEINEIICIEKAKPKFVVKPLRCILFSIERYENELVQEIKTKNNVALYGAGRVTKEFLHFLKRENICNKVKYIVVSNLIGNEMQIEGIPVILFSELRKENVDFLLVTVGKKFIGEIIDNLNKYGYMNYRVIDDIFVDALLRR